MVLCQLTQQEFIDYTDAVSAGTRMPRVDWKAMAKYPLALPDTTTAQRYNEIVEPWVRLIIENVSENRVLTATRDYLLPRLLSGEVPVEAAEEMVGAPTPNEFAA
jgi:type I restriction enzyme S subunit